MALIGLFVAYGDPARAQRAPTQPAEPRAEAIPTHVVVRAVARDAKVIQSSVGGARVIIRDAETGEVLAEGVQEGGSGSTDRIMLRPRVRGENPYDTESAARFEATLALSAPTRVEVTAEGPLDYPQALQKTQTTLLLVPGQHVRGDGIVLPLRGFIVELLAVGDTLSQSGQDVPLEVPRGKSARVRARVRMLCGCPTTPGGVWDSRSIQVEARLLHPDGTVAAQMPLDYAGTTSTYEGSISVPDVQGNYEVQVLAMDAEKTNFGRVRRRVKVE